jgi:glycosyltransferase involved in cell wall biosynthesis
MLGWNELTPRQQRAAVRGLNAFDQIISLSSQQTDFYQNIGQVPDETLQLGTSYIPLSDSLLQNLHCASDPLAHSPGIPADARILVASGYPEEIYQHELCLQALSTLKQSFPVHLVLCLYGSPRSQAYLNQLLARCERSDVTVLWDLDFAEFTSIIRRAALYLRPTQVDSFGLAVADAINAGVPAVASNVCQRYPGAYLIDADQPETFTEVCRRVLTGETEGLQQEVRLLPPGGDELYLPRAEESLSDNPHHRPSIILRERV